MLIVSSTNHRLSAAHVIAEFAQKTLTGRLPHNGHSNSSNPPSYPVICAYVFICRQMYNTCEGVLLLLDYQLHRGIAAAWRQVKYFFLIYFCVLLHLCGLKTLVRVCRIKKNCKNWLPIASNSSPTKIVLDSIDIA